MRELILASGSPRRKQILSEAGFQFRILSIETDETYPPMDVRNIPVYLAEKKMNDAINSCDHDAIIITADTVVIINDELIGKPVDRNDAFRILNKLSGNMHTVITGVCIYADGNKNLFEVQTDVYFEPLNAEEINLYIDKYKPFDKAGAYAIQEWIGVNKVSRIDGDYYNVVGFPMSRIYPVLKSFGF